MGCKGVPAFPERVGHEGWVATVPLLLLAILVQGGQLGPCRDPLPRGIWADFSLCHGIGSPAPRCQQPCSPARHSSALTLAARLQAVSTACLGNARRMAALGGSRPSGVRSHAITQPRGLCPCQGSPLPATCSSAQTGGWPASVADCKGLVGHSAGVKGTHAPAGKLVGSSDKCNGV